LARTMNVFRDAELPFARSEEFLLPPCLWGWAYPVPRTQLLLLYGFTDTTVTFISVRRQKEPSPPAHDPSMM
jgi:hypothetical protein